MSFRRTPCSLTLCTRFSSAAHYIGAAKRCPAGAVGVLASLTEGGVCAALPRRRWELSMSIDYEHKNVARAKILRKNATPQERKLWYCFLASYRPRFQRQKPIDRFIADFYCSKAKLIIEIDGSQHFSEEGAQRDLFRTEKLEKHGLQVVRFSNLQIDTEFQNVCAYIDIVVKEMLQPK